MYIKSKQLVYFQLKFPEQWEQMFVSDLNGTQYVTGNGLYIQLNNFVLIGRQLTALFFSLFFEAKQFIPFTQDW